MCAYCRTIHVSFSHLYNLSYTHTIYNEIIKSNNLRMLRLRSSTCSKVYRHSSRIAIIFKIHRKLYITTYCTYYTITKWLYRSIIGVIFYRDQQARLENAHQGMPRHPLHGQGRHGRPGLALAGGRSSPNCHSFRLTARHKDQRRQLSPHPESRLCPAYETLPTGPAQAGSPEISAVPREIRRHAPAHRGALCMAGRSAGKGPIPLTGLATARAARYPDFLTDRTVMTTVLRMSPPGSMETVKRKSIPNGDAVRRSLKMSVRENQAL